MAESLPELFCEVEHVGVDRVRLMVTVVSAVPVDVGLEHDQSQCERDGVAAEGQEKEGREAS
jgi:hypothetical protein